jgi:hypothetical protein
VVAGGDALRGEVVGQTVGSLLHFGVGAALAFSDQVLAISEGIDRRFEQVGEIELHDP